MAELNRLSQTRCDADIEFVVIGGFAAMLHGASMLTRNLEVCAVLSETSSARLRQTSGDRGQISTVTVAS